jgi:hypothetical protein
MIYQILSPIPYSVYADSYKEAIKNYINFNHQMNINNIIITDQKNHMKALLKYYKHDGRNKVGINMFPIDYTYPMNGNNLYPMIGNNPYPMIGNNPYPIIGNNLYTSSILPSVINIPVI